MTHTLTSKFSNEKMLFRPQMPFSGCYLLKIAAKLSKTLSAKLRQNKTSISSISSEGFQNFIFGHGHKQSVHRPSIFSKDR